MSFKTEIKKCQACEASVTVTRTGGFKSAHSCPKAGETVPGVECPECHGPCVWTVGPFSTFRACAKGKYHGGTCPGLFRAPRGSNALKPSATPTTADADKPIRHLDTWKAGGCVICDKPHRDGNVMWCNTCQSTATFEQKNAALYMEYPTKDETAFTPTQTAAPEIMATSNTSNPTNNDAAASALWALVGPAARAEIEKLARDAASKAAADVAGKTVTIEIKIDAQSFKVEPTAHRLTKEIVETLALCKASGKPQNAYISGPAGSGKTTLAKDVAKAFGVPFGAISCSGGMPESAIIGRMVPSLTEGKDKYQGTTYTRLYQTGGVFLFDEIDAADDNAMIAVNASLANGHMHTPEGEITRHPDFYVICAANTFGHGADRMYVGRTQLDGAFLDRFVGRTFEMEYDRDLEARLCPNAGALSAVWSLRDKVASLKLRRIVGTRFVEMVSMFVASGKAPKEAIARCTVGWTEDDKRKCGISA